MHPQQCPALLPSTRDSNSLSFLRRGRWALALFLAAAAAQAGGDSTPHRDAPGASWSPAAIAWQRINPDGTRFALLEGVRDRAGVAFSYAFFIPAGVWDAAHWHTADARVFVARGTLHLGYGDVLDRAQATSYPAGSYLLVPAGARHYDGSDEDTLILGTATGPWNTFYVVEPSTPSAGTEPRIPAPAAMDLQ